MGDYFISKNLKIKFKSILPMFIQLEKVRGYFNFYLEEDDPDYDEKYKKYVKERLIPDMKPIIIYEKNQFVNSNLENKYKLFIQEELNKRNRDNKIEWTDILDITKIETRYERN